MKPGPDPVNGPFLSSPELDYPAAHSMDTHWYAVDAVGHVALFWTGESGPRPEAAGLGDYITTLSEQAGLDLEFDDAQRAPALGFFVYEHEAYGDPIDPYHRTGVPAVPAHVDQFPPAVRDGCRLLTLPGVDFATAERVQPVAHADCTFWGLPDAYLETDGLRVRPIPGRETAFAAFVTRFRTYHPEEADRYVFEGPADGG